MSGNHNTAPADPALLWLGERWVRRAGRAGDKGHVAPEPTAREATRALCGTLIADQTTTGVEQGCIACVRAAETRAGISPVRTDHLGAQAGRTFWARRQGGAPDRWAPVSRRQLADGMRLPEGEPARPVPATVVRVGAHRAETCVVVFDIAGDEVAARAGASAHWLPVQEPARQEASSC